MNAGANGKSRRWRYGGAGRHAFACQQRGKGRGAGIACGASLLTAVFGGVLRRLTFMSLKEYPPAPEWGPDIMASIRFGNACREIDRENAEAIRSELDRAHQSEKEWWRYAKELESNFMRLYYAVGEMMDVLGMHGTICARDDRVQAVMDALYDIDGGNRMVPNAGVTGAEPKAERPR